MNIPVDEQIKLLSKQLKVPTFARYHNIQRSADPLAAHLLILCSH